MSIEASDDASGLPDAVRASILRSLRASRQGHKTPARAFLLDAKPVWARSSPDSVLQQMLAVRFRWPRITATVDRVARGLYWHHRGERVPKEFDVTVIGNKERKKYGRLQAESFQEIARSCLAGERRVVHPKVFSYAISFSPEDQREAAVLLCFYGKVLFLALLGAHEEPSVIAIT